MTIATIESEADPRRTNRICYRITGPTSGDVQRAINGIVRIVDEINARASFIGPMRIKQEPFDDIFPEYGALGEVLLYQPEVT